MGKTVKIGLLGCGTVGGGVIIVLNENRDDIARKAGCTKQAALLKSKPSWSVIKRI